MEIVKIISEHRKYKSSTGGRPKPGFRRVMAIIKDGNGEVTRHVDIPKEKK